MNKLVYTLDVKEAIKSLPVTLDAETVQRAIEAVDKAPEANASPTETAEWEWDPDGIDWNLGAWVCSKCHGINKNIGCGEEMKPVGPYGWAGAQFCPTCGRKMVSSAITPPTDKQMDFIRTIEEFVDEKFHGNSIEDASAYISRNIEEFKLKSANGWAVEHGYV